MRIGTRASAMALAQTKLIETLLRAAHNDLDVSAVRFSPQGDRDQISKLQRHGGKGGAFVAEIRDAIRDGALEAAMHSLKDMPGDEEAPGLVIGAMLKREAAEDALILRPDINKETFFSTRATGRKIGTNSVRRAAFLRRLFPDAEIIHYRGAADTRLRKLDERAKQALPGGGEVGPADALVMAASGLARIGREGRIAHVFSHDDMLPAVGQGVIAVECRADDWSTRAALAAIDDGETRICALAEREMLWVLNGHCNAPIAGHAVLDDGKLYLRAAVMSENGERLISAEGEGDPAHPRELGRDIGLRLIDQGASVIIDLTRLADDAE